MNTMSKILIAVTIVTIGLSCPFVATAAPPLDVGEQAHLIFMREEEKLARDVYWTLAWMYPKSRVFRNIALQAEQTHTDTMLDKLTQFGIDDPVPLTSTLPDEQIAIDNVGEFAGFFFEVNYEFYFTEKYKALTELAEGGVLEALQVGAKIEELDMQDIAKCPKVIVDANNGIGEGECGLYYTSVQALQRSLGNLLAGSKNHLCAFISQISANDDAPECYEAQVLSQEQVNEIVIDQCSEFSDYICGAP